MNDTNWFVSICSEKKSLKLKENLDNKNSHFLKISSNSLKSLILFYEKTVKPPEIYSKNGLDIVFYGHVWYRNELLEAHQHFNNSKNDSVTQSKLIYHLYKEYSDKFIKKLKGLFLILIWDRKKELFLCFRDRTGFIPTFYNNENGDLTFSTTINGIHLNKTIRKICNKAAVADHLSHRWPINDETFYENIKRLNNGHKLEVKNDKLTISDYWQIDQEWIEKNWETDDIDEKFEKLLVKSINNYLEIGKNSIFLSGGLDSVSIGAYLSKICEDCHNYKPLALSLKFQDPECDEELIQRGVSEDLSIPQYLATLDQAFGSNNYLEKSLEYGRNLSSPLLNFWLPAYDHLATTAKENGYDVVLTGSGGDEWLGVSPYYMADLVSSFNLAGIYKLIMNNYLSYNFPIYRSIYLTLIKFGIRPFLATKLDLLFPNLMKSNRKKRMISSNSDWVAPDSSFRKELTNRAITRFEKEEEKRLTVGKYGYYFRGIQDQNLHALTSWEMEETFEYSRSLDLNIFHPYLDSDMVEFLICIKPEVLNTGGRTKGIVRNLLIKKFPKIDYKNQRKIVSINYFQKILIENFLAEKNELNNLISLSELGIIDKRLTKELLSKIKNKNNYSKAYHIWDLYNLENWVFNNF